MSESCIQANADGGSATHQDVDTYFSVGDPVYALFYDQWYPGQVLSVDVEYLEVLWDDEFTRSRLPHSQVLARHRAAALSERSTQDTLAGDAHTQEAHVNIEVEQLLPIPGPPESPPPPPWACAQPDARRNEAVFDEPSGGWQVNRRLRKAAQENDVKAALDCIQGGACVNSVDRSGRTALFHAAGQGSLQVVEALLEYRANPNAIDVGGDGPVDEVEYWIGKRMLGKATHLNLDQCSRVRDLLHQQGGQRCNPNPSASGRRGALETLAGERGLASAMPWLQPRQPMLMPPGG